MRREIVGRKINGFFDRLAYRLWARSVGSSLLYKWIARIQKWKLRRIARDGWVSKLPKMAAGWTDIRDMPAPASKTFHQLWKSREDEHGK
jgi:L-lactate dehydrogenase complex protein LldF